MDYVIGIDEVGRGALAGPVAVAAVLMPKKLRFKNLKDSKKLTPKKREEWFEHVRRNDRIFYAISMVSPRVIERINISEAANLAATRAFNSLIIKMEEKITNNKEQIVRAYLDGGLYITLNKRSLTKCYKVKTLIRGDEKINAVKLASIVAKVSRDRLMVRNHKKYPEYGFERHKGYGTKAHFSALRANNICRIHRKSFLKNL